MNVRDTTFHLLKKEFSECNFTLFKLQRQINFIIRLTTYFIGGTRWRSWLSYCVTNRKVAGSNPDVVIGFFHLHPSGRTMVLGLTQPLTEMSARNVS
jgi:hypothetical protein